jgi:hypothetical protein
MASLTSMMRWPEPSHPFGWSDEEGAIDRYPRLRGRHLEAQLADPSKGNRQNRDLSSRIGAGFVPPGALPCGQLRTRVPAGGRLPY